MSYPHTAPLASPSSAMSIFTQLTNDETTAIVMCQPVYSDGPGTCKLALGDGSAKSKFIGVVIDQSIAPAAKGAVLRVGVVTASSAQWDAVCSTSGGLTYGTLYYLSTTVAGKLVTSNASGNPVIFGLGPTVGAIVTGGGSGGITNSAAANVVMKSDGTNSVASSLTDDGTQFKCSLPGVYDATYGQKMAFTLVGPQGMSLTSTGNDGYDTQMVLKYTGVGHVGEMININTFLQGTADTTAAPIQAIGVQITNTMSKSAGANPLTNSCITCNASGGDTNYCLYGTTGDIRVDGNAQFWNTITRNLTILSGYTVDMTASGAVKLGTAVAPFQVPGSASVNPVINVGISSNDGTQLQCKNTVAANGFCGIDIAGDTTVNASINPGLFLYRGAGGGLGGAVEGAIAMCGSAGGFISGSAVNDLIIQNQTSGKRIIFSADGTGYTLGAQLDSSGNFDAKTSHGIIGAGRFRSGNVTPNSNVTGNVGDYYTWTGGGAGTTLWVKESGNGTNTGWVGK